MYITRASFATSLFGNWFSVGPEGLVSLDAPVDAAGKLVVFGSLVVHFLAAQIAAGNFETG